MVPHSSSYANSISDENMKSAHILSADRQFLYKFACLNRIRHYPANASQKHRLPAMARLYGRQWQHYLCFNTNSYRRQEKDCQQFFARRLQHRRHLTCAMSPRAYNMSCNNQRAPYAVEFLIRTAPHTYRSSCAASVPNRKLMLTLTRNKRDGWRGSCLKCKQPPRPDGCLTPHPTTHPFYAS